MVDHAAPAEGHNPVLFSNRQRQVFPVDQVCAYSMPPAHVTPRVAGRVVLIEKVVLAVVINEPVRVVHPVDFRAEVKLRP